jgi:glutamyl-tRNA synthetase
VHDQFSGAHSFDVQQLVGDFLVANRQRQPVYQLAVVIDDHVQQVTDVVRGDDLLTSTPRQMLLQRSLGLPSCNYWHLPLVVGADGHRLAKRHGDTRVAWYRDQGVRAERLLGLMAQWSGWTESQECTLAEFVEHFRLQTMPKEPHVFTAQDHAWLLAGSTR